MGFKNGCCGCSLRTASLIIGWLYLADQLLWLTLLVGSATFSPQSDFPSTTVVPRIEAETFMQKGEKIEVPDVIKPFVLDGKPDSEPEITGFQTIQLQFGILNNDQDSDQDSYQDDKIDPYDQWMLTTNADYDVEPNWAGVWFRVDDKTDDLKPESDGDLSKTDKVDDFPKLGDEMDYLPKMSDLDDHFAKLEEHLSTMHDQLFPKLDDDLTPASQDSESVADKSGQPDEMSNLFGIFKSFHVREKRDAGFNNNGMDKKMEVDSPEFILNLILISFSLFCTFLLILGALKGYYKLLMMWTLNASFLTVLYLSWVITLIDKYFQYPDEMDGQSDYSGLVIIFYLFRIALNMYMITVVYSHYKELKEQGNRDNNLKLFMNNKAWTDSTIAIVPSASEKEKEFV